MDRIDNTEAVRGFGNNLWEVLINVTNHRKHTWNITSSVWDYIALEFDLFDWVPKGYITVKNPYDSLEKANYDEDTDAPRVDNEPYQFRMDARDELTLSIKDPELYDFQNKEVEIAPEFPFELKLECIIYDTEDGKVANIPTKEKTLYFWDKKYEMMLEKNIQFSTAYIAANILNKRPSRLTNDERSLPTGIALQHLLIAAGFEDHIDKENWDIGEDTILYTSPSEATVIDDIKNILDSHVSDNGSKCILYYNRDKTEYGKLQLIPISKFFEKAGKEEPGELQLERFYFEDSNLLGSGPSPSHSPELPKGKPGKQQLKDADLLEYNKISSYEFVDIAGIDNAKGLLSRPVYWYNNKQKQFGADFEINEIQNVKKKFKELYTDELHGAGSNPHPIFPLNQTKTDQYAIDPQFVWADGDDIQSANARSNVGAAHTMLAGLLLNECIHFRVIGSTHRVPGSFIAIDRLHGNMSNHLDYKLCGQWFVVNVKHIMYYDKYVNDITAVKIHSYENLKINEEVD